jgi:integrase
MAWDQATRVEARDFCRWLQVTGKQPRPHWRAGDQAGALVAVRAGEAYAPSVRAHSETVLRAFYDFHLDVGSGPVINPFPLDRSRRGGRAHAHHNPMEPYRNERSGLYRPRVPDRIPRSIPDSEFNEIFAGLPSHRDRALVAFYVSTGARASELLSATSPGVDPGRQLITVVRKGTRELQELPASTDAFVWLRLYQVDSRRVRRRCAPRGSGMPTRGPRRGRDPHCSSRRRHAFQVDSDTRARSQSQARVGRAVPDFHHEQAVQAPESSPRSARAVSVLGAMATGLGSVWFASNNTFIRIPAS